MYMGTLIGLVLGVMPSASRFPGATAMPIMGDEVMLNDDRVDSLEQIVEPAGRIAGPSAGQSPLPAADSELLKNRGQIKN